MIVFSLTMDAQLYEATYKFGEKLFSEPITYSVRFVTAIL